MTSYYANKSGWGKWLALSVISALTVSQLTHCGPKGKSNSAPSAAQAAATPESAAPDGRGPVVVNAELKVDELKFSSLDNSVTSPSAKAVLKSLREKKEVAPNTLAMALIELHLIAEGRGAGSDDQVEKMSVISKIAETLKAKKIEDLKGVYKLLEKSNKSKMRLSLSAITLGSVLEKNEVQSYSGLSLLALVWLHSPGFDASRGLVLIEEGHLKLAELRNNHVMAIDPETMTEVAQDMGTLQEYNKDERKKAVTLPLFVIHEVLKKHVQDQKAWAVKIQRSSNAILGLQQNEAKFLLSKDSSIPVAQGKSQSALALNSSELFINGGKTQSVAQGDVDLPEERVAVSSEASNAQPASNPQALPLAPAISVNSGCFSHNDISVRIDEDEKKDATLKPGIMHTLLSRFVGTDSALGRGVVLVNLANIKKMGFAKELESVDPGLMTRIASEQINGGRTFIAKALRVSLNQGQVIEAKIMTERESVISGEDVEISKAAVEILSRATRDMMADDIDTLVNSEGLNTCQVSGS